MARNPSPADAFALLRSDRATYMAQADRGLVGRVGAIAYALTVLATMATLPVVPPTELLGPAAGWAITAVLLIAGLAAAAWSLRSHSVALHAAYAVDLAMLAGLGAIGWLAQDGDLYSALPVLVLVLVGAVFPPSAVAVALVVATAAQLPALIAVGADVDSVVELGLHVFTWACVCALALVWTAGVRVQRHALREHARVDALTGLGNRRAFEESAAAELARSERAGHPLSLLVGDLDGFKAVNDRHGHLAGDECLRSVAAVVRELTRRPDSCFRWGGDEFAVLLPDADQTRARLVAARLTGAVASRCRAPDGQPLGLAFGVAEREAEAEASALLARADADLRMAKIA